MKRYRSTTAADWVEVILRLVIMFTVIFAGLVLLGPVNILLLPIVFVLALAWIILWHTRTFAYRCSNCSQTFEITAWQNLLGPHFPDAQGRGWKILKCPSCGARARAEVIRIDRPG
jgi:DNA-directed RNA polymerase subunit RPC12/RpoP